ncbi:MAG: hypothetical protein EPN39_14435, partial [Chitinophagaceae bacterium]
MSMLILTSCSHKSSKHEHKSNAVTPSNINVDSGDSSSHCSPVSKTSLLVANSNALSSIPAGKVSHEGMVRIPGGEFMMGATDEEGRP